MAFFTKDKLSESAFGRGIKVGAVSYKFPTLIHESKSPEKDTHEVHLWAHNESDALVKLYLCVYKPNSQGEVESVDKTTICYPLPQGVSNSLSLICPGLVLDRGAKIKAYAEVSDKITLYGYVNQLNQTTVLAQLAGFGSNAYGESNHPVAANKSHEILFDPDGNTVACGNQFNLAVRPNGTVFGWGVGNIVTELLRTGDNAPWKQKVNVYSAPDHTIISSDGIPPHDTPYKNINAPNPGGNPNKASKQDHYFLIPKSIQISPPGSGVYIPRGNVGVAVDGVPFDIRTAEVWSGMQEWEKVGGPGDLGIDVCGGHVQPNGKYHYHIDPKCLYDLNTGEHSPVIGYAFDGLAVYGPVGYTSPMNTGGGVSLMESSYRLKQGNRPSGSGIGPGGSYDGTYVADYEFITGTGDLDGSNARFAITPEYPTGSWHYHVTVTGVTTNDPRGTNVYPYIIGKTFKAIPTECNFSGDCTRPIYFPPKIINDISKVEVGYDHAIALSNDGDVITWGDNTYGQCQVPSNVSLGATDISAGGNHSLAVQAGRVIAWGRNDLGQTTTVAASRSIDSITMIESGESYIYTPTVSFIGGGGSGATATAVLNGKPVASVSITSSGDGYTQPPTVVFSGGEGTGASGVAVLTSSTSNPAIGSVSSVTLTSSGDGYTSEPSILFIDDSSACLNQYVCGTGASGVANMATTSVSGAIVTDGGEGYTTAPSVAFTNHLDDSIGNGAGGVAIITGIESGLAYPVELNGVELAGISKVSAGGKHSIAMFGGGTGIAIWGDDTFNQLGGPALTPNQKFLDITAGGWHNLAVINDPNAGYNYVSAWGALDTANQGQTAIPNLYGNSTNNIVGLSNLKIAAGEYHSLILLNNGTILGLGADSDGRSTGGSAFTNVNSIISNATSRHSFATTSDVSTKQSLLGSSGGKGIPISLEQRDWATCTEKTHIHRTNDNANGTEELWLWAHNRGSVDVELQLYIEPKETSQVTGVQLILAASGELGGAGYDSDPEVLISGGGGEGAQGIATIAQHDLSDATGYVASVAMSAYGSGYYFEPTVIFTGGISDPTGAIPAIGKGYIETGETITYIVPPQSGLYLLQPGRYIPNLCNIRATTKNGSPTDQVEVYGYVNRLQKGLEGNTYYYDNPYQTSGSLTCNPMTALTGAIAADATTLPVATQYGFANGDDVTINPYGSNEENVFITGFGSFKISGGSDTSGTVYAHTAWERVIFAQTGAAGSAGSAGSSGGTPGPSTPGGDPYGGGEGYP